MKLSMVVIALVPTLVGIGCGQPVSPAGPSSIRPGGTPESAASQQPQPSIGAAEGPSGTAAASGRPAVPFKGTLEGEADPPVFEPPPSPYFSAHLEAEGQATHLGRFTMDFSHRVNLATLIGIGKAVFTAANGDTLMTDAEGRATPAGSPTAFTVVEIHTVTGGTGRFAGASGRFTITRAVDFANPFTSGEIEGSITTRGGTS